MLSRTELPYHLRATRLRWEALAINLDKDEELCLKEVAENSMHSEKERRRAKLLLGLHQRIPIHDLCEILNMDRRTLFKMASELTDIRERRKFFHRMEKLVHV